MTSLLAWLFYPVRYFYKIFAHDDSPRQLALGVAFGLMIGILPKENLIAFGLSVFVFAFRVNLGAALCTGFLASLATPVVDPVSHGIGTRLLSNQLVYTTVERGYELPIVSWTSLNNTVVIGGFLLGIALFYPAYHLSIGLFDSHYERVKKVVKRTPKKEKQQKDEHSADDFDWSDE